MSKYSLTPTCSQLQEPNWYGVLNSAYSRLRPQLQVALTLEEEGQSSPVALPIQAQEMHSDGILYICISAVSYTHLTLPTIYSV